MKKTYEQGYINGFAQSKKKIEELENNWELLKKYIKTEIPEDVFIDAEWFVSILDKMNELERKNKNENNEND